MKPEIIHSHQLVSDAVTLIKREAEAALAARGEFRLALSGGNTPKPVYEALAEQDLDWSRVVITFGDERCVPPDDAQSNYRMAKLALFDRADIPESNILRIEAEREPAEAAARYENTLRNHAKDEMVYRHDLLLLGMGPDGHTASLFPETAALSEARALVVPNFVPKFNTWRITMTYPLLNASRHICFLVSKAGKEPVLDQVLAGTGDYPSAHVRPSNGQLTWLIGE